MIKAGLVGLGKMGISHCSIINTHPEVDLVAVCDGSKFVLSCIDKYAGIKCFKNYKKMIDTCNLDCVIVATPTKFHADMVQYALKRNLHVFVEKPFCLHIDDGQEMVAIAEHNNLVNQVGYHNRFVGTFQKVRELVRDNAIGEVYHFLGEAYGPVVLKEKGGTWRSDMSEGGGCLYDYASHVINLVQFILGNPDSVSGTVLKKIYSKGVDDAVYATILYDNGLSGQLSVNWSDETYRKMSTQITILGKRGKIIADAQECKIYLRDEQADGKLEKGWNLRYVTDLSQDVWFYLRGEEYSAQIDHFIQCIKTNNRDNINSFASALQTDNIVNLLKNDAMARA